MLRTKHSEMLWSIATAPTSQESTREIAKPGNWATKRAAPAPLPGPLSPGELVTVRTRNSEYRVIVLDDMGCHVLVQGGRHFPFTTEAWMLDGSWVTELLPPGAAFGHSMVFVVGTRGFMTSPIVLIERERSGGRAA